MGRCDPHLNLEERRNLAKWLFSPAIFEVSGLKSLATVALCGDTSALQTR